MSHDEQNLRAVLEQHGDGVRVTGDLAERAIARDRSNRRRELGVGALAAGLVLAVAVPVGWAAVRPADGRPIPAGPTTSTSASTSASTGTPDTGNPTDSPTAPGPSRNTTTGPTPAAIPTLRPTGAPDAAHLAPASGAPTASTDAGYVVDGTFRLGATSIPLPADLREPGFVARLGDGVLVSGPDGFVVVGADGRKGRVIAASQEEPRVSDDRSHALLTDADGTLVYADSTGRRVATLPPRSSTESGYRPAGLVRTTAYAARPDTGASIAWDVTTGRVTPLKGELTSVSQATGTGIAYERTTAAGPGGSNYCNTLLDLASGRPLWRICGPLRFLAFSDDGRHLLATGHIEGFSPWRFESIVVVRASDGAIVLQGGGTAADRKKDVVGARLGAGERLALQVSDGDSRSLQSCGLDGACEVVGRSRSVADLTIPQGPGPYVLSAN